MRPKGRLAPTIGKPLPSVPASGLTYDAGSADADGTNRARARIAASAAFTGGERQERCGPFVNKSMTRRLVVAAWIAAALLPATATAAMNGPLSSTCAPAGQQAQTVCYGGDVITRDAQAYAQPDRFEPGIQAYER